MQKSRNGSSLSSGGTAVLDEASLAARFEEHWDELVRFSLNRKLRSSLYRGPAGELSHPQLAALNALAESDLRMSDLASSLGLAESSATRLVDRLETAGLAERRAARPDDRRCVVAGLTTLGKRVLRKVRAEREEFLEEILKTLDPAEQKELVRLFGRVADAVRQRQSGERP